MDTAIQRPDAGAAVVTAHSAGTLGERLASHYAQRIGRRQLQPGARLPSVRDCARTHGVSPSTVVAAYDRLQAQGLIEARRQRGFFVRPSAAMAAAPRQHEPNLALPAPVDTAALIRAMFRTRASLPGPGLGTLPETWLDPALLQRALRRAIANTDDALRYGEPAGDPSRAKRCRERLSNELGITADSAQIVTSVGDPRAGHRGARVAPAATRCWSTIWLGGGACAAHQHGHALAAGAARPGRA
jgi:DNA-binding transcriptional MocR family regulator